jgi:hypothetical protein
MKEKRDWGFPFAHIKCEQFQKKIKYAYIIQQLHTVLTRGICSEGFKMVSTQ